MTDSLTIWGTDYTGVKGFKANDGNDNILAYVRPQGTKTITSNGSGIDVAEYAYADITIPNNDVQVDQDGGIILPTTSGGGITLGDIAQHNYMSGAVTITATRIFPYSFERASFTSVSAPNCRYFSDTVAGHGGTGSYVFAYCTSLESIDFPELLNVGGGGYQFAGCTSLTTVHMPKAGSGQHMFEGCTSLVVCALPWLGGEDTRMNTYTFSGCSNLEVVDLFNASITRSIYGNEFRNCSKLQTIVLRPTSVNPLGNISSFTGTPFDSGGTGGTIYIPKALYDHLGDGTSNDYKAATNWSTMDGYGTITWAQIEGSQYENYYADGTPISA